MSGCTHVGADRGAGGRHAWTRVDTVRIGAYEEPDALNPVTSSMSFATDIFALVFDGLIKYDAHGRAIPDLALAVPSLANGGVSRDGTTITYHLVRNARWHDGVPFTSRDVAFTFRALMNPANLTATRTGYDHIAAVETPDAYTVRLRLRQPYAPAVYLFRNANQGAILPEHLLGKEPNINRLAFNSAPVGTGPYRLRRWQHGSDMTFDANPAYFGGAPKIPHVIVKFIRDQNTMLAQLRTHEIDLYYDVPAYQVDQVRGLPDTRYASVSTLHWEHLAFNTRRPPLCERAVRLALVRAVDESSIFAKVYHGAGTPFPVHFNPDIGWGDKRVAYYPYDLARANRDLEAAGWRRGSDGVRRKNGEPLAFAISTVAGVKNRETIEVLLQSAWRSLGADVSVKNYPAATLFAPTGMGGMLDTGKTDVSLFTWANTTPDPDDETYIAPDYLPPAGQNVSFYQNATVGRLVREAQRSYVASYRHERYDAIQRILIADVPEYVLDWLPESAVWNDDLIGVAPAPVGSDLWNIATWSYR